MPSYVPLASSTAFLETIAPVPSQNQVYQIGANEGLCRAVQRTRRPTLGPVAGEALDKRRREAAGLIDRIKSDLDPIPPEPHRRRPRGAVHARLRQGPLQAEDRATLPLIE